MSSFDATLSALAPTDDKRWTANPDESWRQGRTLFGGLSAALCYAACERLADDLPPLRSAQVAFIGPAADAAMLNPAILRRGKSVTFASCDLEAGGALAARTLFCFGGPRPSALADAAPRAPDVAGPDDCEPLFPPGYGPTFAQHLHQRLAGGYRPLTGAPKGAILAWVRHKQPPGASLAGFIALGDALPPAAFPQVTGPAAISTMTWQIDLIAPESIDPSGWFLFSTKVEANGDGYSLQEMAMWNEAGDPVAIGRQTVAVFA
jgi:acyl-CoA thioesterase